MGKQNDHIEFGIKEIKEVEFMVNERIQPADKFDYNYQVELSTNIPAEVMTFTITANFLSHGKRELFLKSKSYTTFLIKNLKKRLRKEGDDDEVDIPDNVLVTMFSISFSHARALLARSSAGTRHSHIVIPLINPEVEFRKMFKNVLKDFK